MTGHKLLNWIEERGGTPNSYADITYGTVISPKPLKVQLSERIILTEPFLILGRNVVDHKEKVKIENIDSTMIIDGVNKNVTIKHLEDKIMIEQKLKADDKVAMFRLDGGQQFYIFEKLSDEALQDENS